MVDEVAQKEGTPVAKPGEQTPQDRVAELEQTVAGKDSDIAGLQQAKTELEAKLQSLTQSLNEAIASYKTMVVQANPEVEELIIGDTIEAVNASLSKAKVLVGKVRQGVEASILRARVPAGAPERTVPDLSTLSPREKIQHAINTGGKR